MSHTQLIHPARVCFLVAVLAGIVSSAPRAEAAPASLGEVRVEVVTVADLNLKTEAGAQTLLGRLKKAAVSVCGDEDLSERRPLAELRRLRACRKLAIEDATRALGSDRLTRLVFGRPIVLASR
jgi:UrcA family protein